MIWPVWRSPTQTPLAEIAEALWGALQAGLITPTNNSYKAFAPGEVSSFESVNPVYRFLHDRVQKAAYGLIAPSQQAAIHLAIGQRLLAHSTSADFSVVDFPITDLPEKEIAPDEHTDRPPANSPSLQPLLQLDQQLFNIVNHLNRGTALLTSAPVQTPEFALRQLLMQLNLRAGRQARANQDYSAALMYFTAGITLLSPDSWQTHYSLTLTFHNEAADVAHLKGDLVRMQQYIDTVLQQTNNLLDKIDVYEIQIQAAIGQNHFLQGLDLTLKVLGQFGVVIADQPTPQRVQQALCATAERIGEKPILSLVDLPAMEDPQALWAMRLLVKAVSAAYIARPDILPLLVCTGIDSGLIFGHSPLSPVLYGWYGAILCGLTGEVDRAQQMGDLALMLLASRSVDPKSSVDTIEARVGLPVYGLIRPWMAPLASVLTPLQKSYQRGLEKGDSEYAAWAMAAYGHSAYLAGHSLEKLAEKLMGDRDLVNQLQQPSAYHHLSLYQQVTLNLLGHSHDPAQLEGEAYSQSQTLPIQLAANDITGLAHAHINQGILAYIFDQPQTAQASFDQALNYVQGIQSSQWLPALCFYDSLACLAIPKVSQLPRVIINQQKLKAWANLAPMNHLHRWHLVEAERCRLSDEKARAIDHYDQAIALAQANQLIQEEAIANELAAKFYLLWGKNRIAQSYMSDAYYAYSRWGARAKILDLEKRYAQLLAVILQTQPPRLSSTDTILAYANTCSTVSRSDTSRSDTSRSDTSRSDTTSSSTDISAVIDLTTLLHTSQILSREIELDKLLSALLDAVVQNAGADKCILLMPQADQWVIEAFFERGKPPVLLQAQPVKTGDKLPLSVFNQVKNTCEPAVIFNAAVQASLSVDPYVLRTQPKSVLCTPILSQGKLIAILYLENNLTIGAFTAKQVEVLNLICTQAAISLENARLYHQAQQALEDLRQSHIQLVQNEKMSALGNLVAGVAHEINNPINFLQGNLKPALNYVEDLFSILDLVEENEPREVILGEMSELNLAFIREDLLNLLHSMNFGVSRIRDISHSLRTFSRADQDCKTAFNIHEGLDSTLLILKHRLRSGDSRPSIKVVKNYASLPNIHCFAGQLNQVFMNLIANAIDAIEEDNEQKTLAELAAKPSQITITTALANEHTVMIRIADNGPGMDEAVQARVFDHLFTTKPVGKGTGLGLAIAYAIVVEKHGGMLTVCSEIGAGTVFEVTLPVGG
ncbi:MAG: GAF domain-containing protein [Phormidesmis sp. RL_2_1]|nr:GAF domain-containing protein [Phormidesmis sp. RL_2_1]